MSTVTDATSGMRIVVDIWKVAGPLRRRLATGVALRMVQGLLGAVPVGVIVVAVDQLLDGGATDRQIVAWTAIIAASIVAQYLVGLQAARLTWVAGYEHAAYLRLRTIDRLRHVPLGMLSRRQTGDVATVLTQDIRMIEPVLADVLPVLLGSSVTPVVLVAVTLAVDWRLGLAALISLLIAVPVFLWAQRRTSGLAAERQQRQASAVARMLEYVTGIAVIRAYNQTGERMDRFREALDEFRATNLGLVQKVTPMLTAMTVTIELAYAAVLLVAIHLVTGGDLDVATVLVFLVFALRIYQPLLALINQAELLRIASASLDRVGAILDLELQHQPEHPRHRDGFAIALEDVSFAHDAGTPDHNQVLDGVSFHIPEGSLTALVGPSGAGKSTIAGMIVRFWDVQCGHVRIGGVDVRDLAPDALIDTLTVVLQDSYLFSDSIAANLRVAAPDASDARLRDVARVARCHDFITALPESYDTVIGEGGATLSGGERQRICIARALLKDSPIVILDEPTAAIDPTNERLLQQALSALVAGRTVLVIAHRLATIRDADQILVLDEGRIVERGRHDDLVDAGGRYARLWSAQQQARGWRVGSADHGRCNGCGRRRAGPTKVWSAETAVGALAAEQLPVAGAAVHQLGVGPVVDDSTAVDQDDAREVAHRRQPMRDRYEGDARRGVEEVGHDGGFVAGVDLGGHFVKEHQWPGSQQRPRQAETGPFAARHGEPGGAEPGVHAGWELGDEALQPDDSEHAVDLGGRDVGAERQVVAQVGVEQGGRLPDGGGGLAQGACVVQPDRLAVDPYLATVGHLHPGQQR